MSSAPLWMPLYIADYNLDTAHLGACESGAYLHLIMHYWVQGKLPSDDRQLAHIARMTTGQWAKARPVISAFFDGEWKHQRIERERSLAIKKISTLKTSGRAGGIAKSLKNKESHLANATNLPLANGWQNSTQPQPPIRGSEEHLDPTITPNIEEPERVVRKRVSDRSPSKEFEKEFEETFYPAYPLKQAKPKALGAFIKARRKASLAEIMDGLSLYIRTKNPDYAYAQPASWLNAERWNDQPAPSSGYVLSLVPKTTYFAKRDTPQWEAWNAWYWKTKNKSAPSDRRGGWDFPTEFPPEILEVAQ